MILKRSINSKIKGSKYVTLKNLFVKKENHVDKIVS